jgi:hypothetical protein
MDTSPVPSPGRATRGTAETVAAFGEFGEAQAVKKKSRLAATRATDKAYLLLILFASFTEG